MDQTVNLALQRVIVFPVPVSECVYRDPRAEIQVFLSLGVLQPNPFSSLEYNGKTVVGVEHVLLGLIHDCLGLCGIHDSFPPPKTQFCRLT